MIPELENLKKFRKKLKISQVELARALNLNQSTISRIENGEYDPPFSKVKLISDYLSNREKNIEESSVRIEKIMSKKIMSISPQQKLKEAIDLMNKYNISQLPIIEDNKNLGSISSKKAQEMIMSNKDLSNVKISDVKELPFPEVDSHWNLNDVSDLLEKYPAVLIRKYNKYVGIVTHADYLKLS